MIIALLLIAAYVVGLVLTLWPVHSYLIRQHERTYPSLKTTGGDHALFGTLTVVLALVWPIVAAGLAAFWASRHFWDGFAWRTESEDEEARR